MRLIAYTATPEKGHTTKEILLILKGDLFVTEAEDTNGIVTFYIEECADSSSATLDAICRIAFLEQNVDHRFDSEYQP